MFNITEVKLRQLFNLLGYLADMQNGGVNTGSAANRVVDEIGRRRCSALPAEVAEWNAFMVMEIIGKHPPSRVVLGGCLTYAPTTQ